MIYVLEVNPRASRTVPFVSKATGLPLAKIAARCMAGSTLAEQGVAQEVVPPYFSVKEAVFPFIKFPGADTILGPEMKSTGEVMGVGETFRRGVRQVAAGRRRPAAASRARCSSACATPTSARVVAIARELAALGFQSGGHARHRRRRWRRPGSTVTPVNKVAEGRPHIVDMIKNGEIALIVNTVEEKRTAVRDSYAIRRAALQQRVTIYTTLAGARAACTGMRAVRAMHQGLRRAGSCCDQCALRRSRLHCNPVFTAASRHRRHCRDGNGLVTTMNKIPLTVNGAEKLRAELQELKTVQRPADHQRDRRGARARRSFRERRICRRPRSARASSRAASPRSKASSPTRRSSIRRCSTPTAAACSARPSNSRTSTSGEVVTYQIVGDDEADIKQGKISISSPIARALIGKSEGDVAEVQAPGGVREYEILDVKYI